MNQEQAGSFVSAGNLRVLAGVAALAVLLPYSSLSPSSVLYYRSLTATFLILERERTHPQAVSCSCFIVDSQSTWTLESAPSFRSHTGSTGALTSSVVATTQDVQLWHEAGEAFHWRTTVNSKLRSDLGRSPTHRPGTDRCGV